MAQEWTPSHASLLPSCPCRPNLAGLHPSLQVPFQADIPRPASCSLRRSAGSADHHTHFSQSTQSFFPKAGLSTDSCKARDSLFLGGLRRCGMQTCFYSLSSTTKLGHCPTQGPRTRTSKHGSSLSASLTPGSSNSLASALCTNFQPQRCKTNFGDCQNELEPKGAPAGPRPTWRVTE